MQLFLSFYKAFCPGSMKYDLCFFIQNIRLFISFLVSLPPSGASGSPLLAVFQEAISSADSDAVLSDAEKDSASTSGVVDVSIAADTNTAKRRFMYVVFFILIFHLLSCYIQYIQLQNGQNHD